MMTFTIIQTSRGYRFPGLLYLLFGKTDRHIRSMKTIELNARAAGHTDAIVVNLDGTMRRVRFEKVEPRKRTRKC